MKILTASQLRTIDRLSGDTLTLMENAGTRVVEAIEERFDNLEELQVYVLCGKGSNGGDGFVVARLLLERGCVPHVLLFAREEDLPADAAANLASLKRLGESPLVILDEGEWAGFGCEEETSLVVDALLGTGLTRPVEGLYRTVIESLPACFPAATILAVDIPSGLSADSGEPIGAAVQANLTVTFTALKPCLVFPPAHKFAGDVIVADIGNPPGALVLPPEQSLNLITTTDFPEALHRRVEDTHKGDYGKVLIVGGSRGKSGAAAMAGQAALRSGAGLVTVATPSSCLPLVAASMLELMTEPLEETSAGSIANASIAQLLKGKTVIGLGPGLGAHPETQAFARVALGEAAVPVVLDADGLNAFAGYVGELRGSAKRPVVVTPHPGEMGRLIDRNTIFVNSNRIDVARAFAVKQGLHVVLKGFRTVVAMPDGRVFINATGNPGMATAGMGDILTGMLAGIAAQENLGAFSERILFAVHLHGIAGDLAAEEIGEEPLVATDLLYYIGTAWEQIRE
jgi:ADP-dependent NAD(P)H-hydrate dehydratase / NAD(P)H-hydrate epimerase